MGPVVVFHVKPGGGDGAGGVGLAGRQKPPVRGRVLDLLRPHEGVLLLGLLHHVVGPGHHFDAELLIEPPVGNQPAHVAVGDGRGQEQIDVVAPLGRLLPLRVQPLQVVVGVAHPVVALQRVDLVQAEGDVEGMGEQVDVGVDPAVAAGFEPGVHPLVGSLGLRRPVDPLVVEQDLAVGIEGGGHRAGPGNAGVVVVVAPRGDGGVDVGVGHADAELRLDAPGVVGVELDGLGGLEGVVPRPGAPPLAVGGALHPVGTPVGVHRGEVAVVRVDALQPPQGVLHPDVPLQHLVAALLRRGLQAQGEAVAVVPPGDLMAVLHDLVQPVGADAAAALVIGLERPRRGDRPDHLLAFLLAQRRRVGDRRQRLLIAGRDGDEDALEEVVAEAVGLGDVAQAAVDLGAAGGDLGFLRGVRFRSVRPVPVPPDRGEDRLVRLAPHQYPRIRGSVGEVRHDQRFRVRDAGHAAEVERDGLAAVAPDIEDERLLPQAQLVVHDARAHGELRLHHAVLERGRDEAAFGDAALRRVGEPDAAPVEWADR